MQTSSPRSPGKEEKKKETSAEKPEEEKEEEKEEAREVIAETVPEGKTVSPKRTGEIEAIVRREVVSAEEAETEEIEH